MKLVERNYLKRKGCKNCALATYEKFDEFGERYLVKLIEPYKKGKEFCYVSKTYVVKNVFVDNTGRLKKVNITSRA